MKRLCLLILILLLLAGPGVGWAQEPPFSQEIKAFKKADSVRFPLKKGILFVGSSSFNYWKDVQNYFPGYPIINRGFGGSSLPDVIQYADDIIFPYQPKEIVIYCGENDLAASDTVRPELVLARFEQLFKLIRKKLPRVPVVYVSIKPSPSRKRLMPRMVETNQLIKAFLKKRSKAYFVDVYYKMLQPDGSPIQDIFGPDQLHMNAKGYAIWKKEIQPYLIKRM